MATDKRAALLFSVQNADVPFLIAQVLDTEKPCICFPSTRVKVP
jgi:hypothetical protein